MALVVNILLTVAFGFFGVGAAVQAGEESEPSHLIVTLTCGILITAIWIWR